MVGEDHRRSGRHRMASYDIWHGMVVTQKFRAVRARDHGQRHRPIRQQLPLAILQR